MSPAGWGGPLIPGPRFLGSPFRSNFRFSIEWRAVRHTPLMADLSRSDDADITLRTPAFLELGFLDGSGSRADRAAEIASATYENPAF